MSDEGIIKVFRDKGGVLTRGELLEAGMHSREIHALLEEGVIQRISRGVYTLTESSEFIDYDFAVVAKKVPDGVICLISALYFYRLTNQIPDSIYVALPQKTKAPKIDYPPIQYYWFSEKTWGAGIFEQEIGGVKIKCYSKEKTIVDCFKHRNKIGIEVAVEALKNYWHSGSANLNEIQKYAKISRMEKIMQPYLEAIINEQS